MKSINSISNVEQGTPNIQLRTSHERQWTLDVQYWMLIYCLPPGVNALLAYISLRDFKQADPSGSAVYVITFPQSLRIEILAGVPE
ncbi:hypothetical protein [Balneola sp. EhC07]|uniref:hypothetical protein n=1 Tax=Balneola sp. EhC07 TaxID=1849360 RepID=UPI00129007BC|nr:hypothetical protein [Balneola sp. EhC07]